MQRTSPPGDARRSIARQFGGGDATVDSAALGCELPTIDEPHNGHTTDAEQLGGLLSTDNGVGRQYNRLGTRLQHIYETKERVTSRIRHVERVARLAEHSVKRGAQALRLVVCNRPSHVPSILETLKTHTFQVLNATSRAPSSLTGEHGGEVPTGEPRAVTRKLRRADRLDSRWPSD